MLGLHGLNVICSLSKIMDTKNFAATDKKTKCQNWINQCKVMWSQTFTSNVLTDLNH